MFIDERKTENLINKLTYYINNSESFIALLIDIDDFHDGRSTLSRDEKIRKIHEFLNENLSFSVNYLGKDEFFSICSDFSIEHVISELYVSKKNLPNDILTSFTAGIAEYPKNGKDEIEIFRLLEESIYQGKKEGKNKIIFAHDTKMKMKNNYYTTIQLERLNELSRVSGRNESSLLREALDILLRIRLD
ncbi:hypothetical protein [Virgibacillus pantothenticus]|uniref:hypothetical protein n=1 Tax=Virgibacillus pantothenticus TaxID=1473 RepID=UPI00098542AA|nr:hypothetical protein [Virgibacillus pantothenticus]